MKKILLLFLAPLLMASQCDNEDPLFRTEYFIQNSSSVELVYTSETAGEVVIPVGQSQFIASDTNSDTFVSPGSVVDEIQLYVEDSSGELVLVYQQQPIDNDVWTFEELETYDAQYTLVITDIQLN